MPRLAKYPRIRLEEYALSAAIRCGKRLGLPLPARLMAPPSINVSNIVDSWASPGVSSNTTGLPLPSHRTCILVENPPWLRPKASLSGPDAGSPGFGSPCPPLRSCPSSVLVSTHDGAICEVDFPLYLTFGISVLLYLSKDSVPDTSLTPSVEARGHRFIRTVSLWQVLPRSACSHDPQHAVDDGTVVFAWPACMRFLWWEQRS